MCGANPPDSYEYYDLNDYEDPNAFVDIDYPGAPLVCIVGNVPKVVGISSFNKCDWTAKPKLPQVFTKVEDFYDWIQLNLVHMLC